MRSLVFATVSTLVLAAQPLLAQAPPSGECTGDSTDPACGAPEQSGGGCGCGGGSILINYTDQGDSYQYADDFDDDGVEDGQDNAPFDFNPDQLDSDSDRHGTGERASADASDDGRSADILPDQVSLLDGDERSPGAIRAGELSDLDALDDEADPDAEA